ARAAIRAVGLRWALSGFDGTNWGSVSVFRADNGEEVAGARCHWSAIVKRGVTEPSKRRGVLAVTAGPVIAKIPAAVGASRTARSAGRCGEPPASAGLDTQVSP